MGLESCEVEAIVALSDMDKAKEFYVGLPGGPEEGDGGITYSMRLGDGDPRLCLAGASLKTPDASSPVVKSDRFHPALASA
jgi:hypothetical protein